MSALVVVACPHDVLQKHVTRPSLHDLGILVLRFGGGLVILFGEVRLVFLACFGSAVACEVCGGGGNRRV
jgi:hypothetical protein